MLLNEEQKIVLETARRFANETVKPLARRTDAEHRFPKENIPLLRELGFMGVNVKEEYGGAGLDNVCYAIIIEELAKACASTSVIVSAHNSLALWPIENMASEAQKREFLPRMTSGNAIGCFALSEPGTGSDAGRLTCKAQKSGDGWIVNGVKNWITNAPEAEICVLLAMHEPEKGNKGICCFIVDLLKDNGVSLGKKEEKLGICGSPTSSIVFEETKLSNDRLIGTSGDGFKVAMKTLDGGRVGIAAQAVGIAQAAFEDAVSYSKERHTFGKPICKHQTIQNYIADMACAIDASRLLTYRAALLKDSGASYSREAAQAKLFASETAVKCALLGIQIHGGYGYVKEFNAERYLRDAKITEIYEGTSEIQRLVIASSLLNS